MTLDEQQFRAVHHGDGPILIIAGAGTGKTTVITKRIQTLLEEHKATPDQILALTFTDKAAREMNERLDLLLPLGAWNLNIFTFHAFCDAILRSDGLAIGIDPGFTLLSEADAVDLVKRNIFSFSLSYFRPPGNPNKYIHAILTHFNRLRDEDITPHEYLGWAKKLPKKSAEEKESSDMSLELAHAYEYYQNLKVRSQTLDYADLIAQTLHLMRTNKKLCAAIQHRYRYILVDEFQDTNFAQNELAILIAGKRKSITVVGDDDQSIYRFRGAAVSNMIQFTTRFPKATISILTNNYRSTQSILDASYRLICNNNPHRLEVAEHINKRLIAKRTDIPNEVPPHVILGQDATDEAERVAKEILQLTSGDHGSYGYKDIAILVRANTHSEPFMRSLARNGIPYRFLGPGQLYRQPEVKDLISYLFLLSDLHNSIACYRVCAMDALHIPARDLSECVAFSRAHTLSLFESIEILTGINNHQIVLDRMPDLSHDGKTTLTNFLSMVKRHIEKIPKESAGQILYYFLKETSLLELFTSITSRQDETKTTNIASFFDRIKSYEMSHEDASVYAVVDWLTISIELGESPNADREQDIDTNAVSILTVHSSKGLEFPIVFLVNLVSSRFPTNKKHDPIPIPDDLLKETSIPEDFHTQEERRLFYVGMTRARDRLYLTAAKHYGEGKRLKKPSPFIQECLGQTISFETDSAPAMQLALLPWEPARSEPNLKPEIHVHTGPYSYSQLETFDKCPLQYKYRYTIPIPTPPSASLVFGDVMHKTLRTFYTRVMHHETLSEKDLCTIFSTYWHSAGFGHPAYEQTMKQRGLDQLRTHFKTYKSRTATPKYLEAPFSIVLEKGYVLSGRIDRIDELEDGMTWEIIDYKTGQSTMKRTPDADEQLSVYALAATEASGFGKPADSVRVTFWYLENDTTASSTRSPAALAETKDALLRRMKRLETSPLMPTPGKHCEFCEFRLLCEAWK